jgi:hypothetical protein
VLLLHGYNVDERSGQRGMSELRQALEEGAPSLARQILTVTWPGNEHWWRGGAAAYFVKVGVARRTGRLLRELVVSEHANGAGSAQLVLVAHSLGSRVVMEFLRGMERANRPATLRSIVVILMAAAVPTHLDNLMAAAHQNADYVVVLHSTEDTVLRRWFRLGQTVAGEGSFPEALGHAGNPHHPPWSHERRMLGFDHGDYWADRSTADVIGEQLQAFFPDVTYRPAALPRSTLPNRSLLDETALLTEYATSGY